MHAWRGVPLIDGCFLPTNVAVVVAGDGSARLASEIARRLNASVINVELKNFPDGEDYVRLLSSVKGEDVIVVQTTFPAQRYWRLLLILDACKEMGAARVRAVVPYLAYARQDRVFQAGEALSARVVGESLSAFCSQLVTVDVHKDAIGSFFRIPFVNVSAEEPIARELERLGVQVVLAPDAGARPRAEAIAQRIRVQVDHLEKKRISSEIVEMTPKSLDVRGKSVAIVDDIISTGGTMAKALEQLRKNGAREVFAVGVHGLFLGEAVEKLVAAGAKELVATDTVETKYSRVTVADQIVAALRAPLSPIARR
jgi:ribose-phosphate pyrophosphokinase